ncbi:MAG TPA: glucosaminidase domain-containing protein [Bacteroidales bacterium]|nr:glucosaminidase domain-containing protein [Bacteroidales bacterium]
MSLRKPLIPVLCLLAFSIVAQNRLKPYVDYIAKYSEIAVRQQKLHGVPASITLAQGILESGAGNSEMAKRSNNHFGIKCHNGWEGDTVMYFDDGMNSCFRKYNKPEESFDDHSLFLVKGKRYAPLFSIDVTDYKGWSYGLKNAGYATDPTYADKLIRIIETYDLNDFTREKKSKDTTEIIRKAEKQSIRKAEKASKATNDSILRSARKAERLARRHIRDSIAGTYSIFSNKALEHVKDYQVLPVKPAAQTINPLSCHEIRYLATTPYVVAQYGDSFEGLADEFGISVSRIRTINEFPRNYKLQTGEPVYLDTKTTWWEGEYPLHIAKTGESMHSIAQKYALKLEALYKMNNMPLGQPVKPGTKIKLRNPEQLSPFMKALNDAFNKADSTNVNQPTIK